jgi:hypothetical protein
MGGVESLALPAAAAVAGVRADAGRARDDRLREGVEGVHFRGACPA